MSADDWDAADSDEDWSDEDWPDDDESLTIPCPACKADIYEDAEQCPYCGEYVVRSRAAWDGKPLWWIVLGVLGIVGMLLARIM